MPVAMLTPTPARLGSFAPELSGLSDDELQALINRAEFRVSSSFYGEQYNEAWHLMAAHIGVLSLGSTPGIGAGLARRRKVGDLEVEYEVSSFARIPAQYAGSRHGAELWYMTQRIGATPLTI